MQAGPEGHLAHRAYQPALANYARADTDLVRAVPFGEGVIDSGAVFRALKEGGFDGVASYEMCSPVRGGAVENLDAYAARYVRWMREHVTDPAGGAARAPTARR